MKTYNLTLYNLTRNEINAIEQLVVKYRGICSATIEDYNEREGGKI